MRGKHELERGIVCEKCLGVFSKEEGYTRIKFEKPVIENSTGLTKTISRMNLCNKCYTEFKQVIETFTGRKFLEITDTNLRKEQLKNLRNEILKEHSQQDENILRK